MNYCVFHNTPCVVHRIHLTLSTWLRSCNLPFSTCSFGNHSPGIVQKTSWCLFFYFCQVRFSSGWLLVKRFSWRWLFLGILGEYKSFLYLNTLMCFLWLCLSLVGCKWRDHFKHNLGFSVWHLLFLFSAVLERLRWWTNMSIRNSAISIKPRSVLTFLPRKWWWTTGWWQCRSLDRSFTYFAFNGIVFLGLCWAVCLPLIVNVLMQQTTFSYTNPEVQYIWHSLYFFYIRLVI